MPKILVGAGVPLVSKLKLISWNVNSLRAREPLVQKLIEKENPDILCVQELKIDDGEYVDNFFTSYDYQTISQTQKSYNGIRISSYLIIIFLMEIPSTQKNLILKSNGWMNCTMRSKI